MAALRDIAGMRFGRLMVIKRHSVNSTGTVKWLCVCDCGTRKVTAGDSMRRGVTLSCGCVSRDKLVARITKHGKSRSPEYTAWQHIKERCFVPSCSSFKDYGARGITMCPEWRDSFDAFFAHVGSRPSPQHSIDRINNNGHYEPGNCRWATAEQQVSNRRNNHYVRVDGQTLTVAAAAKLSGICGRSIYGRIKKGMRPQAAFNYFLDRSNHHAS